MITVGTFEAKTHFSKLLAKVEKGEEVVVTRNGKIVARIIPDKDSIIETRKKAAEDLIRLSRNTSLGGLSWKELRDEGRK